MAAPQVLLRDAIELAINTYLTGQALLNDVEASYFPQEKIEDLQGLAKIKVVSGGYETSRERLVRCTGHLEVTYPVQVAIQQAIEKTDNAGMDSLVELSENIAHVCEDDFTINLESDPMNPAINRSMSWQRTEPLKDDKGVPYSYADLYKNGIFQIINVFFFKYLKQANT